MLLVKKLTILATMTIPAVGFFVKEQDVIQGMDPNCPTAKHWQAPYHADTVCDRVGQNAYKDALNRYATRQKLQAVGTKNVPSQKTSFCPQTVEPLTSPERVTGFDTAWIVENTASTPVVVAYMKEQADGSFIEVSAFDEKISPPNHDPKAILKPNEWKSLQTHEGHVFHIREILKDGSMGQVLLQHRVGLYPVSNKYGHELDCNPMEPDPEPIVEVAPGEVTRDPNYAREEPRPMRPCNTLDIGFRNEVGCPLNVYYTGQYQLKGVAKPRGNIQEPGYTPKSCHEVFKFHLGLSDSTPDFMFDWNSKTKYEGTYVGHNFVFRLAKDERIVVDSVALQPTKVIDCPGLKNQVNAVSQSQEEAIITAIGRREDFLLPHMVKSLNGTALAASMNSTEWIMATSPSLQAPSVRGDGVGAGVFTFSA